MAFLPEVVNESIMNLTYTYNPSTTPGGAAPIIHPLLTKGPTPVIHPLPSGGTYNYNPSTTLWRLIEINIMEWSDEMFRMMVGRLEEKGRNKWYSY